MRKIYFIIAGLFAFGHGFGQKAIQKLDNNWQFSQAGMNQWKPATVPGTVHTDLLANTLIEDPFYQTNEKNQQWIDKVNWEYQCTFDVNAEIFNKENIQLCFEGLDTYAEVYLNGNRVFSANNMFRQYQANVKASIKERDNELRIHFTSPITKGLEALEKLGYQLPAANDQSENGGLGPNAVSVFTRKAPYSFGWDWGPRFVTSGIWRPVRLEAWNNAKIEDLYIGQNNITSTKAEITAKTTLAINNPGEYTITIASEGKKLASCKVICEAGKQEVALNFSIDNPRLWWPNGLGKQEMYRFTASLTAADKLIDSLSAKTGLRKLELVQDPDADGKGKSFYFRINGKGIFAKGANYIPNDNFLTRVTDADYESIIKSAAEANMNMLRLWGGGIYENDVFFDLCDKYGILVWHDFMFACSMYPGDTAFLNNIKLEITDNIIRERNHPCVALWCGNNEIETAWGEGNEHHGWGWKQRYTPEQRKTIYAAYDTIFHHIIPETLNSLTVQTYYWSSSPTAGGSLSTYESRSGDMHYWGVWHGKHPFSDFNKYKGRFMSEYGFQSFPEFKTVKSYTVPEDYDITSEVMAAHQRSGIGNLRIKEYMKDWYRDPKDFTSFLYASQVLQAEAIKSAIYAHRRSMPYTMGTLFWQINDCWPVASWSSIDYYKRWKALQYFAKNAYKEIAVLPYLENNVVKIFLASDRQENVKATLRLSVYDFEGKKLSESSQPVTIKVNEGQLAFEKPTEQVIGQSDKTKTLLIAELEEKGKIISSDILYFVNPKDLELEKPGISFEVKESEGKVLLTLTADKLAKNVFLSLDDADPKWSDNYFDIIPGQKKTIEVTGISLAKLKEGLKMFSLVETY